MRPALHVVATALTLLGMAGAAVAGPEPEDVAFFEAKVRPILVDRCYGCHSAEAKRLRGNLRLDSKFGWEKGGDLGPSIVPGNPEESLLVQAVRYNDPALQMPPKGKLPEAEVAALTEWVRRGAPDPREVEPAAAPAKRDIDIEEGREHWAFQPLSVVAPPEVSDPSWCRNPIDHFLLARQEAAGLRPSGAADRRTLLRRVSFDLTGLPPTPEEVDDFLNDESEAAYGRVVDRLLASPRYGERWARHWLDLARFAESHGFEHDYDRPTAYHYRDFVIEALNADLPYDTFVKWQLAGDEYAPDDNLALKATGFLAAGVHSTQITANQVEKERYDELDDMANTTATAFLGLTVGCARCHDHKFDPIPTADYYRFLATFTTTVRSEVDLPSDPEGFREAQEKYRSEHATYTDALASFEADELPGRLEVWESGRDPARTAPRWVPLEVSSFSSKGGATARRLDDGSMLVEGTNAEFDTYTIVAPCELAEITAIRVEALADDSLVARGPGRASNGNFDLTDVTLKVGPRYGIGRTVEPGLVNPKATFEQAGFPIKAAVDADPKSGWAVDPQFGRDHAAVFELGEDVRTDSGATLTLTLDFQGNTGHSIGRFRVSATDSPRPIGLGDDGIPAEVRPILATPRSDRTPEQAAALLAWYKTIDVRWRALNRAVEDHAATEPKPDGAKALISTEGLPAVRLHTQGADFLESTHFLRRGDPNQKGDVAEQGFLQVLMTAPDGVEHWQVDPPEGWRTSYRRRALAEWMTDTEHGAGALLARVIVNRLWQHHFGRGIVATPSDFGKQGEPPSHPELLDWLAVELIHSGWRLKPIQRLIVTSAAYRQSSAHDPAREAIDLDNRLFWRQERRRLEAEAIRDAMLAISGRLDERMFGPGSLDERMNRRSIYFTIKRSQLIPMMTLFDAPDALVPIAVRSSTIVAPQALYLLNSPVAREWASGFAGRVRPADGGCDEDGIREAYKIALGRPPDEAEVADAVAFLDRQRSSYASSGGSDPDGSAWTDLCAVILSLNELLFIE